MSVPPITPKKETIYDGPDVELFKTRHLREEQKFPAGQETVHDGDVPDFLTRRFKQRDTTALAQAETIHEGAFPAFLSKLGHIAQDIVMPDKETVYDGPEIKARAATNISHSESWDDGQPKTETVFDETTFKPKQIDTTASRALVKRLAQRASVRVFAIAGLSLVEMALCRDHLAVFISSALMFVTFVVVGVYTLKMSMKALLIATCLYACSTLFMAINAAMTGIGIILISPALVSRGFMIYNLLRTYGLLVDLHLLEAEIA
jgi:hypothetical protein